MTELTITFPDDNTILVLRDDQPWEGFGANEPDEGYLAFSDGTVVSLVNRSGRWKAAVVASGSASVAIKAGTGNDEISLAGNFEWCLFGYGFAGPA